MLRNERNVMARSHPLFVLRAVLLSALEGEGKAVTWHWQPASAVGQRVRRGAHYGLWVQSADLAWLERLGQRARDYLGQGTGEPRNFSLVSVQPPVPRPWAQIWAEQTAGLADAGAELCLDFLTPLAFTPHHPQQRWRLDGQELLHLLGERARQLNLPEPDEAACAACAALEVRSWFWDFHRHGAESRSGAAQGKGKHEEPLSGCQGPLYLRGDWRPLLPWLVMAAELGLGKRLSLGQGACRLVARRAFFDPVLVNPSRYIPAYEEAREGTLDHGLRGLESELAALEQQCVTAFPASTGGQGGTVSPGSPAASPLPASDALAPRAAIVAELALAFREQRYQPGPPDFLSFPKKDGAGERQIALLPVRDKIFQRTLHAVLAPVCDRQLEPSAHGFRPGRGVESARAALAEALRGGASWVVETDLASFFDQIPWSGLEAAVDRALPVADTATRAALCACFQRADAATPGRGILQGSPLSPLLANLFLDRLDETLAAEGWQPVRYGDDLVIPAASQAQAARALARLEELVAALGLTLKTEKTALTPAAAGFTFLGRPFGSGLEEEAIAEQALRRTVYVAEPYSMVALDHEAVVVRREKTLLARVPLARVEALVVHGTQVLSTPLLMACAKRRIPITFTGTSGYTVNVFRPDSRAFFDHSARHSTRHAGQSAHQVVQEAGALVHAKLHNALAWLTGRREPAIRAALPALEDLANRAAALAARLPPVANPKLPLGIEGSAAALIYPLVNALALDPDWRSAARTPRDKPDRWNALYDFGANLLFARLNAAIRSAGLNPYLGWLHSAADNYESLVCDLMEPFRARLDRWLIKTVNRQVVTPAHLEQDATGRWRFTREGARHVIEAWERELQVRLAGEPGTLAEILHSQVKLLAQWALHTQPMKWFLAPWPDPPAPGTPPIGDEDAREDREFGSLT